MKVRSLVHALAFVALMFGASLASPTTAHALDCGDRLITFGDASAYVRAVCGEPASMVTNIGYGGPTVYGRGTMRSAAVEIWVYDFGPSRFMEELTFVNGILQNDRTLGMGTPAGAAAQRRAQREAERARRADE